MACSHRLTAGSDLHPDPSLFDPGRWQAIRPDRTTYIPFGAGAGKCIGDRFSLTQAVLALATITARWRLAPVRSPAARSGLRR